MLILPINVPFDYLLPSCARGVRHDVSGWERVHLKRVSVQVWEHLGGSFLGAVMGCAACCFEGVLIHSQLVDIFAEMMAGSWEMSGVFSRTEMSLITWLLKLTSS